MSTGMTTPPRALTDPALHRAIRGILRLNAVPDTDVEDLLQDTLLEAKKGENRLPSQEPDRTHYVCGIARHLASRWRASESARKAREESASWLPPPKPAPYEERELAVKLHAFAVAKDPLGTDWLVRAKVLGEQETAIAEDAGVAPERVRKRVSRILALLHEHAQAITAAVLLLIVAGWALLRVLPPGSDGVASPRPPSRVEPAAPDPLALRQRAQGECEARAWQACADDLDAANALDPAGETRELRDLRILAKRHLTANGPPPHEPRATP
jgi:DNA-directed RNA polymerase specialized sigma24 family protein